MLKLAHQRRLFNSQLCQYIVLADYRCNKPLTKEIRYIMDCYVRRLMITKYNIEQKMFRTKNMLRIPEQKKNYFDASIL